MYRFHVTESYPGVCIVLARHVVDNHGNLLLTPDLASEEEIDAAVDELKSQLTKAASQAKKKLQNMRERVKEHGLFHPKSDV